MRIQKNHAIAQRKKINIKKRRKKKNPKMLNLKFRVDLKTKRRSDQSQNIFSINAKLNKTPNQLFSTSLSNNL